MIDQRSDDDKRNDQATIDLCIAFFLLLAGTALLAVLS